MKYIATEQQYKTIITKSEKVKRFKKIKIITLYE